MNNKRFDKDKFREVLNDAEVNFQNHRYDDAAKTFEFLAEASMEDEKPEDMIYFQYRAIISHKIQGNTESLVNRYQKLAINALKASTVYAMSELNSPHVENTIALLWYVQQNLKMLDDEVKRKSVLVRLHQIFQDLLENEDLERDERLKYLDRTIELSNDLGLNDQILKASQVKAKLVEEEGKRIQSSNGIDTHIIAAHKYLEAAKLYQNISESEKTKALVEKAIGLYPEIKLTKYGLDEQSISLKTN